MATFTENYNLIKPDGEDYYDIADFNENMDTLDNTMAAMETGMAEVSEKIGSPDEAGQTVFSLLKGGGSVIRSIQYKTLEYTSTTGTADIAINTVDVAKTFVIMERLYDHSQFHAKVLYTLKKDCIQVVTPAFTGVFGFWIIEFN